MASLLDDAGPFGSSTPLPQSTVSLPSAPSRRRGGFIAGVGAGFMNETEFGLIADAARQGKLSPSDPNPDYTFNPFAYARGMKDARRRGIAESLAAEGVFDRSHGEYHTPEDVEALVDQFDREEARALAAGQSVSGAVGYIGGSFLSVSSLLPISVIVKGRAVYKAATLGAAASAAAEAALQVGVQEVQVTKDPLDSFLDVGIATVLGGGVGAFSQLLTNKALRGRVADAVDISKPVDGAPADLSMGAAVNPDPSYLRGNQGKVGDHAHGWYDHAPLYSWTPVAAASRLAKSGADRSTDMFRRLSVILPGEDQRRGIAEAVNAEDLADIEYTTHAQDAETAYYVSQQEFLRMHPEVSVDDFNLNASLLHEFPDHTTGNVELDSAIRQAVNGQRGSSSFFNRMYEHMNEFGLFPRNRVAEAEAEIKRLEADLVEAQRALEVTLSGRQRKTGSKRAAALQKRVDRVKARMDRVRKEDASRRNYFTQSWVKSSLHEHRFTVKEILTRQFMRNSGINEAQVERALREMRPDDPSRPGYKLDPDESRGLLEEEILESFNKEGGGLDTLPEDVRAHITTNLRSYVTSEVDQLVDEMSRHGTRGAGMLDSGMTTSGRVQGRRLHLDKETTEELMRLGVLDSDPVRAIRSYNSDMGPRLALRRTLGISNDADIETLIKEGSNEIDEMIRAGKLTHKEGTDLQRFAFGTGKNDRGQFGVMVDRVLNRRGFDDDEEQWLSWMGAQAMKINYMSRLRGMTLSAITDLAGASVQAGFNKSPSLMKAFVKNLVRGPMREIPKIPDRDLRQLLIGIENVIAMNGRSAQLGGTLVDPTKRAGVGTGRTREVTGGIERGLNYMSEHFTTATLMTRWNRGLKKASGDFLMMQMHDIGTGKVQMTQRMTEDFARWGLTKSDLEWLAKQPAEDIDGIMYPNPSKWEGGAKAADMRVKFLSAVKRAGEEAVVTLRKGDKPYWMDGPIGRLFGQFTSFSYAWNNRLGRRNLKHGVLPRDAAAYGFVGTSLALGILSFSLKSAVKGDAIPDPTSPEGFAQYIYEGIDRGGLLAMFTAPVNGALKLASSMGVPGLPQASRFEARNFTNALVGPTFGQIGDAAELAFSVGDGDYEKVLKKAYRLAPFNNVFCIDAVLRRTLLDK